MLELIDVSKRFGDTVALADVGLEIAEGKTTALIGPSGCGKSTLLRLIIGLIEPDEGVVRVDGQRLANSSLRSMRRRMGYVIQDGGLFPHLTARGNLALQARFVGWSASRIEARIDKLLDITRLPAAALERYPVQLSGGQRQRVSLMRALMLDPPILLLDEPLGALDPIIRSDLQRDLSEIFERLAKTVVLVTHDLAEAAYLGRHLVLMHGGRIVQEGSYDDLLISPATPFVGRFVNAQRFLHGGSV